MMIDLAENGSLIQCNVDMTMLGFFLLLRPGKYTDLASETTLFTLDNAQLFVGTGKLPSLLLQMMKYTLHRLTLSPSQLRKTVFEVKL